MNRNRGSSVKIKTSDLTGVALDWAVDQIEGLYAEYLERYQYRLKHNPDGMNPPTKLDYRAFVQARSLNYHRSWAQMGPIIEREGICIVVGMTIYDWWAYIGEETDKIRADSPLIAAARCYVASKLGVELEIPEELS